MRSRRTVAMVPVGIMAAERYFENKRTAGERSNALLKGPGTRASSTHSIVTA